MDITSFMKSSRWYINTFPACPARMDRKCTDHSNHVCMCVCVCVGGGGGGGGGVSVCVREVSVCVCEGGECVWGEG